MKPFSPAKPRPYQLVLRCISNTRAESPAVLYLGFLMQTGTILQKKDLKTQAPEFGSAALPSSTGMLHAVLVDVKQG